jgi:hypothetical protein
MNAVPGVMSAVLNSDFLAWSFCVICSEEKSREDKYPVLYLRVLCWFILANGATPSNAMYSTFVGLMVLTYESIFWITI